MAQVPGFVHELLGMWPAAYCWAARQRRGRARLIVDRDTDLVIDSYPRSANSFTVNAITMANPRIRVASHLHRPPHIVRAIQLGVPAVVILRDPMDAMASAYVRAGEEIGTAGVLNWWERFHVPLLDLPDVLYVTFDFVTGRTDDAIRGIANGTGVGLSTLREGGHTVEEVFDGIDRRTRARFGKIDPKAVARPTLGRTKERAHELLAAAAGSSRLGAIADIHQRLSSRAIG